LALPDQTVIKHIGTLFDQGNFMQKSSNYVKAQFIVYSRF